MPNKSTSADKSSSSEGGSDIMVQMHKKGEITDFFDSHQIPSKFSDKHGKVEGKSG